MSEKNRVLTYLRTMSSGTIAGIIGSPKYSLIDAAYSRAILYAAGLSEQECKGIQTMEDFAEIFKKSQKRY